MDQVSYPASLSFGKYELIQEIGRGGFGIVYKAIDRDLNRMVAVKLLHPALVVSSDFVSRFKKEAQTAAQLDHPNLVQVYDYGQIDGRYYFSMTYMAGGSLKDKLIQQGPFPLDQAIKTFMEIAAGLQFCHQKGIIHRDIKPGNILFDISGFARISDLGFAKASQNASSLSLSSTGALIGTPAYMAPEIWRGIEASPQTDIYAMGCILYEMLTGKPLFDGGTPPELMTMHLMDGARFRAPVPEMIKPVLLRALAMDPSHRFKTVAEFSHVLFQTVQMAHGVKLGLYSQLSVEVKNRGDSTSIDHARNFYYPKPASINHFSSIKKASIIQDKRIGLKSVLPKIFVYLILVFSIFTITITATKNNFRSTRLSPAQKGPSRTYTEFSVQSEITTNPTIEKSDSFSTLESTDQVVYSEKQKLGENSPLEQIMELPNAYVLGLSDDEKFIVVGGINKTVVDVYETSNFDKAVSIDLANYKHYAYQEEWGDRFHVFFSHDVQLMAIRTWWDIFIFRVGSWDYLYSSSPTDGQTLGFVSNSHVLTNKGPADVGFVNIESNQSVGTVDSMTSGLRYVFSANLSPGGSFLITYSTDSGAGNGYVGVWDPHSITQISQRTDINSLIGNVFSVEVSQELLLVYSDEHGLLLSLPNLEEINEIQFSNYGNTEVETINFDLENNLWIQYRDSDQITVMNPLDGRQVRTIAKPGIGKLFFSQGFSFAWNNTPGNDDQLLKIWSISR